MSETSATPAQPTILASFRDKAAVEAALSYLEGEAIPRAQISVRHADPVTPPPSAGAGAAAQGETMPEDTGEEPLRKDEHRNLRTMRNSMAAAAAGMAAAGVVVATGGAAIPAVGAALAAGAGAGGLSELASQASGTEGTAATEHAEAIVVVKPANVDQAERARSILERTSALKVWEEAPSA
ncbi:hypothetical protein MVG78_15920 [Roseomonas gilardii subsp. gilardii]|uniref:hypothetical protein n=1 Tax=Roseomonas gilardii TaxID=257708 RepID=UPI001FF974AC|nr:hypothetical protein [Roseomonas gilardii]UPG72001.1 hypothetical protein MVG78_15920 [Roseomonas gilardii subsp. gilardii]